MLLKHSLPLILLSLTIHLSLCHESIKKERAFNRFMTIWLSSQDFEQTEENADLKFLAAEGVSLTNYFAITHPSQPNYLASLAGDYFGLNHDGFVEVDAKVATLVDLLEDQNVTWKGYFEGIPGPGYMGQGSTMHNGQGYDYVRTHNPFASFNSISHNGERMYRSESLDWFNRDVANKALPQFAHIVPNMLNNGHNTTLEFAANWTRSFLEPLLANEYFMNETLILLMYDQSASYGKANRVSAILLGGIVPEGLKGSRDGEFYTHYSILSTIEYNFQLPCLGRHDVGANIFRLVGDLRGEPRYNSHPTDKEMREMMMSDSYGGFLNNDPKMQRALPPPNLKLIGAGGKGVLDKIQKSYAGEVNSLTPYDGLGKVWLPLEFGQQGIAQVDGATDR